MEVISKGLDVTWVIHDAAAYSALVCVVIACFLTFREVRDHIGRFDYPHIQVYVLRILIMVPIYGVFSIASVFFPKSRFFLWTIRDTYESFVLYMFFSMLIAYCGGEGQLIKALNNKRYKGVHPFPMCYLPIFPLDTAFYLRCKRWVLQYALLKPIGSFIAMVTHPFGIYDETNFNYNNVYTYVCIISNLSISWSLYYLVLFDIEVEKELRYCKPFMKFLCIKSIIFFSFWQSVALNIMIGQGWVFTGDDEETAEKVAAAVQDVLMCYELLPVSIMHHMGFGRDKLDDEMSAEPVFTADGKKNSSQASNFDAALSLADVVEDTMSTIFFRRGKLVDKENEEDGTGEYGPAAVGGESKGGGAAGLLHGTAPTLDSIMHLETPSVDALVRYAIANDRGVRTDGMLHFDEEDSDDELVDYMDTDVITRRSRGDNSAVRVDDKQATVGVAPATFCVVCGRYDRDMVRRKSGFKCTDCVGVKRNVALFDRQKEKHAEDNDGSCVVCGRSDRPMVQRGLSLRCTSCL